MNFNIFQKRVAQALYRIIELTGRPVLVFGIVVGFVVTWADFLDIYQPVYVADKLHFVLDFVVVRLGARLDNVSLSVRPTGN